MTRSYNLLYNVSDNNKSSVLSSIVETGFDINGNSLALQPTVFSYQKHVPNLNKNNDVAKWSVPTPPYFNNASGDLRGVEYADINGDGLLDIVISTYNIDKSSNPNANYCADTVNPALDPMYLSKVYINTGNGWLLDTKWQLPMPILDCKGEDIGTRLIDINGDGLSDVVYFGPVKWEDEQNTNNYSLWSYVWLNTGNGWKVGGYGSVPLPFATGDIYHAVNSDEVKAVDINGDGLVDFVRSYPGQYFNSSPVSNVYINTGSGWDLRSGYNVPISFRDYTSVDGYWKYKTNVQFADVNGDGLQDMLAEPYSLLDSGAARAWNTSIYMNTGKGWSSAANSWSMPFKLTKGSLYLTGGGTPDPTSWVANDTELADINGDGLVDVLNTSYSRNTWLFSNLNDFNMELSDDIPVSPWDSYNSSVWINTGNGWQKSIVWNVPKAMVVPASYNDGYNVIPTRGYYDRRVKVSDFNGDGIADILYANPYSNIGGRTMYLSSTEATDFMSAALLPTGAKTIITYKSTGSMVDSADVRLNPAMSYPVQVVYNLKTDDNNGVTTNINYSYQGGTMYFNSALPLDRKFAGFTKTTKNNNDGSEAVFYLQGKNTNPNAGIGAYQDAYEKIGFPYLKEIRDNDGKLLFGQVSLYDSKDLGNSRKFVSLKSTQERKYLADGSSYAASAVGYTYDAYGNIITKVEYGDVTGNKNGTFTDLGTDKRTSNYTYATPQNATTNMYGFLKEEYLSGSSGSTKYKNKKYYYDGLAFGSVAKGNATKIELFDGASYASSTKEYLPNGLIAKERDFNSNQVQYVYESNNLYPSTITNALNQVVKYEYDYATGQPTKTTDVNSKVWRTVYDPLGREIVKYGPDPISGVEAQYGKTEYVDTPGNISVNRITFNGSGSSYLLTYYDGLMRAIQTRKSFPRNSIIGADVAYDSNGRIKWDSVPYVASSNAKSQPISDLNMRTTYEYDALGRPLSVTDVLGKVRWEYSGKTATSYDQLNRKKIVDNDAYNRLSSLSEYSDANVLLALTQYSYDPMDNLIKLVDANRNIRNFSYDVLGRRTLAEDLHKAADTTFVVHSYTYDKLNNLRSDASNDGSLVLNYNYDALNRLTSVTKGATSLNIFAYDNCVLGKGKICSEGSSDYTRKYEYDQAGNKSKETTSFRALGKTYIQTWTYNLIGVVATVLPDGSGVQYKYDGDRQISISANELGQTPKEYVSSLSYVPTGQLGRAVFANGAVTTNTYDAAKKYRLTNKKTTLANISVQDVGYSYDAVGNITGVSEKAVGSTQRNVAMAYDSLNRMIRADAKNAANTRLYTESYAYDAIGNLKSWSRTMPNGSIEGESYVFGEAATSPYANPQAVTEATIRNGKVISSMRVIDYDGRGNVKNINIKNGLGIIQPSQQRSFVFTENNRLASVTYYGAKAIPITNQYIYDANGTRILTVNTNGTTHYPSQEYNTTYATNGTTVLDVEKHIWSTLGSLMTVQGSGATARQLYNHTDHLTGANVITNSAGKVEERLDYYPFGLVRLDEKIGMWSEQRKFAGHEYDADTAYTYMQARYYDGRTGKFLSQDPAFWSLPQQLLLDPQQNNAYAYARGNPVTYRDPDGKMLPLIIAAGITWSAATTLAISTPLYIAGTSEAIKGNTQSSQALFNAQQTSMWLGLAEMEAGYGALAMMPASAVMTQNAVRKSNTEASGIDFSDVSNGKYTPMASEYKSLYAPTKNGAPSWTTTYNRFWKGVSVKPEAIEFNTYKSDNLSRMSRGVAPQRYNKAAGAYESMELSHEPIPRRDGGTAFTPRWPDEHAALDPFRKIFNK